MLIYIKCDVEPQSSLALCLIGKVPIEMKLREIRNNDSSVYSTTAMLSPQRISWASLHVSKTSAGLNRSQWRVFERQWKRHLSFQSPNRRPTVPASTRRIFQSRTQSTASSTSSSIRAYVYGTLAVLFVGFGYLYITDTRASIHQWLLVPALRIIYADPEDAHHAGIRYMQGLYSFGLNPRERGNKDQELGDLKVEVFGHVLDNPIGTSAGIDKDAQIPSALFALGPAIVEVGGVTPFPQTGNEKPRVFRLPSQNALINRYGLNSEGAEHVAMKLRERLRDFAYANGLGLEPESERLVLDGEANVPPGSLIPGKLLAVQVAKNKKTPDHDISAVARDYVTCVDELAKYADILVVNVSSPNTPGLRDLQAVAPLTAILSAVVDAAKSTPRKTKPAVMVKVSPDEDSDAQIEGICSAVWSSGVDGVIVGNTTKKRPDPIPNGYIMPAREERLLHETGGYSGPQMFQRTLSLVKRYRQKLDQGPVEDEPLATQPSPPRNFEHNPVDVSLHEEAERINSPKSEITNGGEQQLPTQPSEQHSDLPKPQTQNFSPITSAVMGESSKRSNLSSSSDDTTLTPYASMGPTTPPPSLPLSNESHSADKGKDFEPKVIFATGGITNGEQCLQILNAGASVCQIYTAMMYGGVGTITRMKGEMREILYGKRKGKEETASSS